MMYKYLLSVLLLTVTCGATAKEPVIYYKCISPFEFNDSPYACYYTTRKPSYPCETVTEEELKAIRVKEEASKIKRCFKQ